MPQVQSRSHPQEFGIGKVVGRRKERPSNLDEANQLLRTAWALRGTNRLIPRGLYRFETFEEANRWMIQAMAHTHALRPSKM